jgi:hypothetical protein
MSNDNSENYFDDSFIVSGEETFYIKNQKIVLRNTLHVVKDGQEYLVIDDHLYPVDQPKPAYTSYQATRPAAPSSGYSTVGMIITILLSAGFVFFFGWPIIHGLVNEQSGSDNANIISSDTRPTIDPTPKITQSRSAESDTAIKIKNAMDYTDPVTRDFAVSIIPNSHEGNYNIAQICDLWDVVYKRWTYVNDPRGSDYYSPASRTIKLGLKGDCDDFAITVGSLMQSIGGSSRIVTAYNAEGGHAYPEVLIGKDKASLDNVGTYITKRYHVKGIAYHSETKDGVTRYWLNLDWQSRNPGGKFFDDSGEKTIYYPNGYWYTTS